MLRGRFESAGESTPAQLRTAYDDLLAETIRQVGPETVAAETGLDENLLASLLDGESPSLELGDAAAILGLDEEYPDAEAIEAEARDILMMGLSIAVLDVEAVASGLDGAMEPKEIQQKIEGRYPMTLDEYAMLHHYIESQKR